MGRALCATGRNWRQWSLGSRDKTRAEQDDTCSQFEPPQVTPSRAIKPAEHSPELREEVVAALDRIANLPNPRLAFAALGRLQSKACPPCPFLSWAIARGPIGLYAWEAARIAARDGRLCCRRLHHQGLQHRLRLTALVRIGSSHHDPERHGARVTGSVQRRPAFAAIHGAGPSLRAPFFAGFLEPSSNTSSQLIPCRAS